MMTQAATHQLYAALLTIFGVSPTDERDQDRDQDQDRDRGAVSLEQVLWFVAVGVGVAVIAGILWTRIRDTAEETDNVNQPTAP
jgi:hypothetical protein